MFLTQLIAIVIIIMVLTQVRRHCVLSSGSQHGHFRYGVPLSSPCFHYVIIALVLTRVITVKIKALEHMHHDIHYHGHHHILSFGHHNSHLHQTSHLIFTHRYLLDHHHHHSSGHHYNYLHHTLALVIISLCLVIFITLL
jgi:hypothetical protein